MILRYLAATFIVLVIGINAVFLSWQNQNPRVRLLTEAGEFDVEVEIADSPEEMRKGLMFRESLAEGEGMFFIYANEAILSFWMKNTLIPLDMIFLSRDLKVKHIQHGALPCPSDQTHCPTYSSEEKVKYVLEVPGGYSKKIGLNLGDSIQLIYDK